MKKPLDIQKLDEKISRFKQSDAKHALKEEQNDNIYSKTATAWQVSIEFLSAVLIGASVGYCLDLFFGTAPWMLVVLTIMGGAAGMLNLYRAFKAEDHQKE
jgi:ATP synthase protein I